MIMYYYVDGVIQSRANSADPGRSLYAGQDHLCIMVGAHPSIPKTCAINAPTPSPSRRKFYLVQAHQYPAALPDFFPDPITTHSSLTPTPLFAPSPYLTYRRSLLHLNWKHRVITSDPAHHRLTLSRGRRPSPVHTPLAQRRISLPACPRASRRCRTCE
jgi:hypothetical protein